MVPLRAEVLRPGLPRSAAAFDNDDSPTTVHLAAIDAGVVVGVVTVSPGDFPGPPAPQDPDGPSAPGPGAEAVAAAGPAWQLRGMAVAPGLRGAGLGSRLVAAAIKAAGGRTVWCNARVAARSLYERQGFEQVGGMYVTPWGPHVRMVRLAGPMAAGYPRGGVTAGG